MNLQETRKAGFVVLEDFGQLYHDIQLSALFPDSKTFTDAIARYDRQYILAEYHQQKTSQIFDLKAFVENHFIIPSEITANYESDISRPIGQHIENLWPILTRQPDHNEGSLIPLPYPYIVPGGRFREVYYWDSYFTLLGLQVSEKFELIENIVKNFAHLIDTIGFIPNGNRTYYLGRSQPPFFSLMVGLLAEIQGENVWVQYLPSLEKEYAFWMRGIDTPISTAYRVVKMTDGSVLNRYWDDVPLPRPEAYKEDVELAQQSHTTSTDEVYRHIRAAAESGWDFSSRWFKDGQNMTTIHTTDILPVDLNCLLYHLEKSLCMAHKLKGQQTKAAILEQKATERQKAIQKYGWNESLGFYFDYEWKANHYKGNYTLAAVFPLFFKIATPNQAHKVAEVLEEKFLQKNGLLTTLQNSGQQWDAPNGWAPLQWMAFEGLRNYGLNDLAHKIAQRWTANNEAYYQKTGKMMEKYNVLTDDLSAQGGEYPNQDGFGWTNGVYLKMKLHISA